MREGVGVHNIKEQLEPSVSSGGLKDGFGDDGGVSDGRFDGEALRRGEDRDFCFEFCSHLVALGMIERT